MTVARLALPGFFQVRSAHLSTLGGFVLIVLLWELLTRTFLSEFYILAPPTAIIARIAEQSGLYGRALVITLREAILGFVFGNLAAIVLAAFVTILPRTERVVQALALIVFCLPLVATGPILRVLYGPGEGPQVTLAALGVKIDLPPERIRACIAEAGIGFMFAPAHHSAMRHVGPARAELGFRTVFNLIGPLSNPASVKHYLLGVFSADWLEPLANVLGSLGAETAWVVHGEGGLDEMSPGGVTQVAELKDGKVTLFTVTPQTAGLASHPIEAIKGGDAAHNAEALRAVLAGEKNAYRDTVLLNAGAALVVAGKAADLKSGAALAAASIDEGKAADKLAQLIKVSNAE